MGEPRTVFRTDWFSVEEERLDDVAAFGGKPFYRIHAPNGVIVLALTPDGRAVLIRQYRPALRKRTLELPSGAVDEGESPGDTAARELFEETGYRCDRMRFLGSGGVMLSRLSSYELAFCGTGATLSPGFRPREDIEVMLKTPAEIKELVLAGEFTQMAMVAVFLLADWRLGTGLVTGKMSA